MERMPMCRICLAENIRMYIVIDKDLHELYETLTDIPFVTEDRRPMLACFLCFPKLKQCYQLQRKCLEAEELFAQMMNKPNLSVNRGQLKYSSGLTVTPVENISIVDVSHIESIVVKEELPAVCERLDDFSEPEEEHQRDELELEHLFNSFSDVKDTPVQQSESDSEDNVPLIKIKMEVEEEQEVSRRKQRASDTSWPAVAKKRGKKTLEQLEDVITEHQKKNEELVTKVTHNTQNYTSKLIPKLQEPLTTTPRVNISVIDTTSDTNYRNNIEKHNLIKHTNLSTGAAPYKCDIAQPSCSHKGDLIRHTRVHTGEKPFICDICQHSFIQERHLTRHIRTHTREKPYKCEECQLCFSRKDSLSRHIRSHTGEKSYKCEECQRCFSQNAYLKRHIRTHTGEKPYKCEECQICYGQKSDLTKHIRTHTGEKPYKCEECQLCFSQKANLTRHYRTHSGEKPYKCEECQLSFSDKYILTNHMRKHTGEKPYKCEVCQLFFGQCSQLARHFRKHTGEKPYKCEECQRCFSEWSYLTRHIQSRHAGEKY